MTDLSSLEVEQKDDRPLVPLKNLVRSSEEFMRFLEVEQAVPLANPWFVDPDRDKQELHQNSDRDKQNSGYNTNNQNKSQTLWSFTRHHFRH